MGDLHNYNLLFINSDKEENLTTKSPGSKFLVISSEEPQKKLREYAEFSNKKMINNVAGSEIDVCEKIKSGTILSKTKNEKQASNLIQLKSLTQNISISIRT